MPARLTEAQRRALIDTNRRSQPIAELERKARKAGPRGYVERADVALARSWRWERSYFDPKPRPVNFCEQCSQSGQMPFNEETGLYSGPIKHRPRCVYAPDDGPYPGRLAAGRAALGDRPND